MDLMSLTPLFVGCDISLKSLDICLLQGDVQRHFSLLNKAAGHADVLALLAKTPVELFVLEASGGYEAALLKALQSAYILTLFGQRMQPALNAVEPDNQRISKP